MGPTFQLQELRGATFFSLGIPGTHVIPQEPPLMVGGRAGGPIPLVVPRNQPLRETILLPRDRTAAGSQHTSTKPMLVKIESLIRLYVTDLSVT